MKIHVKVLLVALLVLAPALPAAKSASKNTGNMELLNLWGEQPPAVQRVYEAASKILIAKQEASFADLAADEQFQRLCADAGMTHLGGPMLGVIRPDGVNVWLRTLRPAKVGVAVQIDGKEQVFGPVESTTNTDLAAVIPVTGLKPSTRYPYRVLIDGKPAAISSNAAIVTAPPSAEPEKVRIAFGSCYHRWGLGNQKQADLIRQRQATALLLYGDIAVQDRNNNSGMHRADYLLRDFFLLGRVWWQRCRCMPCGTTTTTSAMTGGVSRKDSLTEIVEMSGTFFVGRGIIPRMDLAARVADVSFERGLVLVTSSCLITGISVQSGKRERAVISSVRNR